MNSAPDKLVGVVLAGGHSKRMGRDKAVMVYPQHARPQWEVVADLLADFCDAVYVSIREDQVLPGVEQSTHRVLRDEGTSSGPLSGILTAMTRHPEHAVLAAACDLPLLGENTITELIAARGTKEAVAYRSSHDGLPEPLCAVYEAEFLPVLRAYHEAGRACPRKILIEESERVELLELGNPSALDNANTPEDFARITQQTAS